MGFRNIVKKKLSKRHKKFRKTIDIGYELLKRDERLNLEGINKVYNAFGIEMPEKEIKYISGRLQNINKIYPGLFEDMEIIINLLYSQHIQLKKELKMITEKYEELVSDFNDQYVENCSINEAMVELTQTSNINFGPGVLKIMNCLNGSCKKIEDIIYEGELDKNQLLKHLENLGVIAGSKQGYVSTLKGENIFSQLNNVKKPDYKEYRKNLLKEWNNFSEMKSKAHKPQVKDYLSLGDKTEKFLSKVCNKKGPHKKFNKYFDTIIKCLELKYHDGDHRKNHIKGDDNLLHIIRILDEKVSKFL
ncbi:hypothetical protein COX58_01735 [archaeon CG_4_10_14_0_2_um_filter_Archaea_38_6]|nr:MAG: hypothetical protein COS83_01110 [archaeon CG07_land_8_20_14_0_80_38_8]PIU88595.1 MAG: hypothetical protein COS64_03090 [archaeon CG06_land_8_20_14_3_00_37_11]PIX43663.1 MAG: hypothetical protein COZ55_01020 [archaeon CG_4_8_14_3_um_filter_38_5]PJA22592.1 MAG: hypothetical protein COX58_01735 [archaeon CG_4_10_14_0_2_um_filter_Archaea_38_6]